MPPYLMLGIAIVGEVAATVSLKLSENFSKLVPSAIVVVGYVLAFGIMGVLLKQGFPIGVAYAIWAAAGVALVAAIGALFLGERFTMTMAVGLLLVIGGVVMLEVGREQ
jgi:small multidrug resistance pump